MKFFKKLYYKYIVGNTIKTVHLRGRLTEEETLAYSRLSEEYNLKNRQVATRFKSLNQDKGVILEIGFGNGGHLVDLASNNQDKLVVGVEMYRAGVYKVMEDLKELGLRNCYVYDGDTRNFLDKYNLSQLESIFVLFPDPWPKKRHNKRRLLKKDFILKLLSLLKSGGSLTIATDWQEYAFEISECLDIVTSDGGLQLKATRYKNDSLKIQLPENGEDKSICETTFANRAIKEGRDINIFRLVKLG